MASGEGGKVEEMLVDVVLSCFASVSCLNCVFALIRPFYYLIQWFLSCVQPSSSQAVKPSSRQVIKSSSRQSVQSKSEITVLSKRFNILLHRKYPTLANSTPMKEGNFTNFKCRVRFSSRYISRLVLWTDPKRKERSSTWMQGKVLYHYQRKSKQPQIILEKSD